MFKEVKVKKRSNSPSHSICKEKKNTKNTGTFLGGSQFVDFRFSQRVLEPKLCET